jgi:hypothetical protein
MRLGDFLATWGAVTATVAIVWNLVRDLKDSGKLRVDAMVGKMHPDPTKRSYLVITITNVGRRPVMLKGLYTLRRQPWSRDLFKYRLVKYRRFAPCGVLLLKEGPRMLKEGEYHTELVEDFSFLDRQIGAIAAYDSGGKEWWLRGKRLSMAIKDAETTRTQSATDNNARK